jgi:hypothetical protein
MNSDEYHKYQEKTKEKLDSIDLEPILKMFSGKDIHELMTYIEDTFGDEYIYCMFHATTFKEYLQNRYGKKFNSQSYETTEIYYV